MEKKPMNHIKAIENLQAEEVRDYIKQNINDDRFIYEILENKEKALPLIIKSKMVPERIIVSLSKNIDDSKFLLESFIEFNYIPSLKFIESLSSFGEHADGLILSAIKAFPSLPIPVQFLMKLINDGFLNSAIELVKMKKEFQKHEIMLLLLKTGTENQDFISIALTIDSVVDKILNDFNERYKKLETYSKQTISEVIMKIDESLIEFTESMVGLPLRGDALAKLLRIKPKHEIYTYRLQPSKLAIKWTSDLEDAKELIGLEHRFTVTEAPSSSKYRAEWLRVRPGAASNEELLDFFEENTYRINTAICIELMKRPLDLIKKVNLDLIYDYLSPGDMKRSIGSDLEKALHLFHNTKSKYQPALRKMIPIAEISEEKNKRKRSYFTEAFDAIKSKDIDSFRLALSKGYGLDNFVRDSHQSSKEASCQDTSLPKEFISQLTKEEILQLTNTPFRFNYDEDLLPKFLITVDEALDFLKKFDVSFVFSICSDKCNLILNKTVSEVDISSLFYSKKEEIMADKLLFKSYLNRASKNEDMEFDVDSVKALAKVLNRAEIKKFVRIEKPSLDDYIDIICADNEYFVSDSEILTLVGERSVVESVSFYSSLIERNKELAKTILEAYLEGNKALAKLAGKDKVNIKRTQIDRAKSILAEIDKNPETIVDDIFNDGGSISEFKEKLINWKISLNKFSKGRSIKVERLSTDYNHREVELSDLLELPAVKFEINQFVISSNGLTDEVVNSISSNIQIKSLIIGNIPNERHYYLENASTFDGKSVLSNLIKKCNIKDVSIEGLDTSEALDLISYGLKFNGSENYIGNLINNGLETISNLNLRHFKELEKNGLVVNEELVTRILEFYNSDVAIMTWLSNRLGGLGDYCLSESDFSITSDSEIEEIKKTGINILSHEDFNIMKIEEALESKGTNFEPVDISNLSLKEKIHIIRFIETKIDANYLKLNLTSSNIESLEELKPYQEMRAIHSIDDQDLVSLLNIPTNLSSNKKIMKGIRDLLSMIGGGLTQKIMLFKKAVEVINPEVELTLADFINYDDHSAITEAQVFTSLRSSILKMIESEASAIQNQNLILKNKSKADVLKFLRTASAKEDSYIRDTLNMINSILNGVDALNERVKELTEDEEENKETIIELKNSIKGIIERLTEVSVMADIEHMHDRLVPLSSFIKSDPAQIIGQDKFRRLEKNQEVADRLGYKLYFPKSRADLQVLGDENGWCVNYNSTYGDDVLTKGNILVGICEQDKEPLKENVIALAHYLRKNDGTYQLEQLKWSSKKKGGRKNEDATKEFNHRAILGEISTYLKEYNKRKKAE